MLHKVYRQEETAEERREAGEDRSSQVLTIRRLRSAVSLNIYSQKTENNIKIIPKTSPAISVVLVTWFSPGELDLLLSLPAGISNFFLVQSFSSGFIFVVLPCRALAARILSALNSFV